MNRAETRTAWLPGAALGSAVIAALRSGLPLLLYGLRLWIAVCLALYIAFRLELPEPSWAGTTASIVCQPSVGASLRKGWFRMIGTAVGATMAVVLTGCFPQSRVGFLLALALWAGLCAATATLLRNFASYAAALSGYTAAIVASDELGLVGGANGEAFTLAVARASEIGLGIVCAGVVLAGTDWGGARRQFAARLETLSGQVATGLAHALGRSGAAQVGARAERRALHKGVAGLGTLMDQAAGEISAVPFRPVAFRTVVDGLFGTLSAWRAVALHLERHPDAAAEAAVVRRLLPEALERPEAWRNPVRLRAEVLAAARALVALPPGTPSFHLLVDRTAGGLLGIARALNGLAFFDGSHRFVPHVRAAGFRVPDPLLPLLNGLRAFLVVATTAVIWIATAWPGGATMMLFATVSVVLFAPREDAYASATEFLAGTALTAAAAAVIGFAVLPNRTGFGGFAAALSLVLVPTGALSAQAWHQPAFVAFVTNFIPLLGPDNPESYDPASFYNTASALLSGVVVAMMSFRLLPPLPPAVRAQRLVALTLRDFRRLVVGPLPRSVASWEGRIYGRLAAMPDQVDPLQHARLSAALTVGTEVIRLRRVAARIRPGARLAGALDALAAGRSGEAIAELGRLDALLAGASGAPLRLRQRSRGTIRAIIDTLEMHADYFGPGNVHGVRS